MEILRQLLPAYRRGRSGEPFIQGYELPLSVRRKFEQDAPDIEWGPVERGLREWLICCAYRQRRPLAMPSRAVDYAWHSFILDTVAYRDFCEKAYGRFLDHIPDTAMTDSARANRETVWAWDRSLASEASESILWGLDEKLDLENPLGIAETIVAVARANPPGYLHLPPAGGWGGGNGGGFFDGGLFGDGGFFDGGGDGGGCGGGGCGGGCGGG